MINNDWEQWLDIILLSDQWCDLSVWLLSHHFGQIKLKKAVRKKVTEFYLQSDMINND